MSEKLDPETKKVYQSLAESQAQLLPDPRPDPEDRGATIEHCTKIKALATTYFKEQRFDWAGKTYTDAIECLLASFQGNKVAMLAGAGPFVHTCYSNAALCAVKLQQWSQARDMCTSALECHPSGQERAKVLFRLGTALVELGDPRGGAKHLLEAAKLDPKNGAVRAEYARARAAAGLAPAAPAPAAPAPPLDEARAALAQAPAATAVPPEAFTQVQQGGVIGGATAEAEAAAAAGAGGLGAALRGKGVPEGGDDADADWWYTTRTAKAQELYDAGKHKEGLAEHLEVLEEALKADRREWVGAAAFGCGVCASGLQDNAKVVYFMGLYTKMRSLATAQAEAAGTDVPAVLTEGGPDRPPKLNTTLRLLGLAHFALDQRDEALMRLSQCLEAAGPLDSAAAQADREERAQIHMRIASLHDMAGAQEAAIEHCRATLGLTKVTGHLALCHDNLARLYGLIKQGELAERHAQEAADLRDQSTLDTPQE